MTPDTRPPSTGIGSDQCRTAPCSKADPTNPECGISSAQLATDDAMSASNNQREIIFTVFELHFGVRGGS
jgi:hypothetical protein